MKKSRPGVLLACLCREEDAGKLAEAILRHTTTLGVRRMSLARTLRPRSFRTVQTLSLIHIYGIRLLWIIPFPWQFPGNRSSREKFDKEFRICCYH